VTGLLLPKFVTQSGLDLATFRAIVAAMDPDEGLVPRASIDRSDRIHLSSSKRQPAAAASFSPWDGLAWSEQRIQPIDLGVALCAGLGRAR